MNTASTAPKIAKPITKMVAGLVWSKGLDLDKKPKWETVSGLYRLEIWCGIGKEMFSSVWHLDPRFKVIDPNLDRLSQDCLLNEVHPRGETLEAIMEDAVRLMNLHAAQHGRKFAEAKELHGQDLKVGMMLHHKGVFSTISEIRLRDPERPSQGWTVLREFNPLWIAPDHPCTVWEIPASEDRRV